MFRQFMIVCWVLFSLSVCVAADDQTGNEANVLTAYSLRCYEGELIGNECVGGYWMTNQPQKFRVVIDTQVVVSWWPDMPVWTPTKYNDCAIASLHHWTCRYDDRSGEFGFRDGQYYQEASVARTPDDLTVDQARWLEVQEDDGKAILEHRRKKSQE